jgi:hypothetical protein
VSLIDIMLCDWRYVAVFVARQDFSSSAAKKKIFVGVR